MGLTSLNQGAISFKKVSGKSHTDQNFAFSEEGITTNIQSSSETVFAQPIESLPITNSGLTALYSTNGTIQRIKFPIDIIPNTQIGVNQSQGYKLKLPADWNTHPGALYPEFSAGTYLYTALGKLQIVPALYGTIKLDGTTEFDPILTQTNGTTVIAKFDSINWYFDPYSGIIFVQDPPAGYDVSSSRPGFLEAYLYVGDYMSDILNIIVTGATGTTGLNVGSGVGIFKDKVGQNLRFKSLTGLGGISITGNSNNVILSFTGTTGSVTGATNGLSLTGAGKKIALGGLLTGDTFIDANHDLMLGINTPLKRFQTDVNNRIRLRYVSGNFEEVTSALIADKFGFTLSHSTTGTSSQIFMSAQSTDKTNTNLQLFATDQNGFEGVTAKVTPFNLNVYETNTGVTSTLKEVLVLGLVSDTSGTTDNGTAMVLSGLNDANTSTLGSRIANITTSAISGSSNSKLQFSVEKNSTRLNILEIQPTGGAQYVTDVSSGFTNLSLVNKGFVTGLITTSGIQTANNGLTKAGTNVHLGGALTGNTVISGDFNFQVGNFSVGSTIKSITLFGGTNDGNNGGLINLVKNRAYMMYEHGGDQYAEIIMSSGVTNTMILQTYGLSSYGVKNSISMGGNVAGGFLITDNRSGASQTGIQYATNYSSKFTPRSLVDKGYVTGLTTTSGIQTANNGLTKTGTNVHLGGTLTGNTTLTLINNNLVITGTTGGIKLMSNGGGVYVDEYGFGGIFLTDHVQGGVGLQSNGGGIFLTDNTSTGLIKSDAKQIQFLSRSSFGPQMTLTMDYTSGTKFNDARTGNTAHGIEYFADYSSGYTSRSLVDYGFITASTITANNGLTKVGKNIHLGGVLTGSTTIGNLTTFGLDLNSSFGNTLFYGNYNTFAEVNYILAQNQFTQMYSTDDGSSNFAQVIARTQGSPRRGRVSLNAKSLTSGANITLEVDPFSNRILVSSTGSFQGMVYGANYSGNFTTRSLVDKGFVTGLTTTSGVQTVNNGLTKAGTNVHLGGAITGATQIGMGVNSITFTGTTGTLKYGSDLSANYTVRSLVDKGFVTGLTTSIGSTVTGTSFTALTITSFVGVSGTSASQIYLPTTPTAYKPYIVTDIKGNAATINITVNGNGKLIQGSSTALIDNNYGSITFIYNQFNWSIVNVF